MPVIKILHIVLLILFTKILFFTDTLAFSKEVELENFPITMTFKAFLGINKDTQKFSNLMKKHKGYNWIHAPGINTKKIDFIKKVYPNKIITIQDAWGGSFGSQKRLRSWAGYWLYKPYTLLTQNISPTDTQIFVEDGKKIIENQALLKRLNKRIKLGYALVIYPLDHKGNPVFEKAEHLGLIDIKNNKLTIKRSLIGDKARYFKAGKTAIATHIYYWTNQWQVNMSLDAPRNPKNDLTGAEWYANVIADRVHRSRVDGIEFDVARWIFSNYKRYPIDCNDDGNVDNGYIEGINSFGLGGQIFLKNLREQLGPDKIIQMDSNDALTGQRGWQYVNGIQMESFPMSNDFNRFSEAFQYLRLWSKKAMTKPTISYAFTKTSTTSYSGDKLKNRRSSDFRFRMGLAVDCLLGLPHPFLSLNNSRFSPDEDSRTNSLNKEHADVFYWDEYFGGDLNRSGWLGKPIGSAIRHNNDFKDKKNLIDSKKAKWKNSRSFDIVSSKDENAFVVDVKKINEPVNPILRRFGTRLNIPLKEKLKPGQEYTLIFDVKGEDTWIYRNKIFKHVPRSVSIRGVFGYNKTKPASILADSQWEKIQFSFIAGDGNENNSIEFGCGEQIGKTELKNVSLYNGAIGAQWSREFENGMILLNTSNKPWNFKFPAGSKYKRIKGSLNPDINNGKDVINSLTIPGKDALFLLKLR